MTIDEAVASGLVRIPISLDVMIPNHLLQAPEPRPAPDHDPLYSPNGVPPQPPGSPLRRRFGN